MDSFLSRRFSVLLMAFIFIFTLPAFSQSDDWKLAKNKSEIQVYTRKVEGNPLKEYKVVTRLKVDQQAPVSLLRNISKNTEWIYNCQDSYIVKQHTPDDFYVYYHVKSPWPVADRDMVIRFQFSQEGKTIICRQTNAPDLVPLIESRVRIPVMDATWQIVPQENGYVEVSQQVLTAPGGSIPKWLVNTAIVDAPFYSFVKLRNLLST